MPSTVKTCCYVPVGKLDKKVEIQELVSDPDATSGLTETYNTLIQTWANIKNVTGLAQIDLKNIGQNVTDIFTLRFINSFDLTSEHWLLYKNWRYRIRTVININQDNVWQELSCERAFVVGEL